MDLQDVDCAFEKCMADRTAAFSSSSTCFINSSRHLNRSSTARNLEYFAIIFLPTTSVLGIICNLINIFVLSRIKTKSCFLRLLYFLAVFDTGVLLPGILHSIPIMRMLCSSQHGQAFFNIYHHNALFEVFNPFAFSIRCSRWLTVAISFERFLGISYPLKFPAKYRKSRHFVISVLLINIVDTVILYHSINKILFHTIPFIITPILVVMVLNFKILFTLITMEDITGSSKEKVLESALVLISVVIIYLFCWTPTIIRFFYFEVFKTINQEFKIILLTGGYCAIIFNSSINFFIYCLVGKRYRRHVKDAFTCSFTGRTLTFSILITLCLRF